MEIVSTHNNKKAIKDFLSLPEKLYSRGDITEDTSDMKKFLLGEHLLSKYFTLDPFVIYNNEKPAARFAVTTYPDDKTAYLGFYECEDNSDTAAFLFSQVEKFCCDKGFARILGPVDGSFWQKYRLKINLFDEPPYTGEPYNKPYYFDQFKANGFNVAEHYISNRFRAVDETYEKEKFSHRYEDFLSRGYRIESPTSDNFDITIGAVYDMITALYSDFPVYKNISKDDFCRVYAGYKQIMDMSMTKIAYYNDKPVGFYISIPDYGNLVYNITPLKLPAIMARRNKPSRYVMLYMGVMPEHRGLGKALVYAVIRELTKNHCTSIGALARDGKVTGTYVSEEVNAVYEYVLLKKELETEEKK